MGIRLHECAKEAWKPCTKQTAPAFPEDTTIRCYVTIQIRSQWRESLSLLCFKFEGIGRASILETQADYVQPCSLIRYRQLFSSPSRSAVVEHIDVRRPDSCLLDAGDDVWTQADSVPQSSCLQVREFRWTPVGALPGSGQRPARIRPTWRRGSADQAGQRPNRSTTLILVLMPDLSDAARTGCVKKRNLRPRRGRPDPLSASPAERYTAGMSRLPLPAACLSLNGAQQDPDPACADEVDAGPDASSSTDSGTAPPDASADASSHADGGGAAPRSGGGDGGGCGCVQGRTPTPWWGPIAFLVSLGPLCRRAIPARRSRGKRRRHTDNARTT